MATARAHVRLSRSADDVWKVVSNPDSITEWIPGVVASCTSEGRRHVTVADGSEVDEEIITNEPALRRFQYRLVPGGVPVESHLATVDVIDDDGSTLVVYAVDVQPDFLGEPMQQLVDGATAGLRQLLES